MRTTVARCSLHVFSAVVATCMAVGAAAGAPSPVAAQCPDDPSDCVQLSPQHGAPGTTVEARGPLCPTLVEEPEVVVLFELDIAVEVPVARLDDARYSFVVPELPPGVYRVGTRCPSVEANFLFVFFEVDAPLPNTSTDPHPPSPETPPWWLLLPALAIACVALANRVRS
jgi:hypothetical protein